MSHQKDSEYKLTAAERIKYFEQLPNAKKSSQRPSSPSGASYTSYRSEQSATSSPHFGDRSETVSQRSSPVPRSESLHSDKSMESPIHLKDERPKAQRSSAVPRSESLRSDKSMESPIHLKDKRPKAQRSSAGSCSESVRRDRSKERPIHLKDGLPKEQSPQPFTNPNSSKREQANKGQTALSTLFVRLEDTIIPFVRTELGRFQRILSPDYFESSEEWRDEGEEELRKSAKQQALAMTVLFLREMEEEEIAETLQKNLSRECTNHLKANIRRKCQCLFEGLAREGKPTFLNNIFTDTCITEGGHGEVNTEHEVRQIETAFRAAECPERTIACDDILTRKSGQGEPIRTVLTKGIAGIGKTILVQRFSLNWAEGKANQHFLLVLLIPFRDLNLIKEEQYSLIKLLHQLYVETKDHGFHNFNSNQVLLIFDGLDESRLPLDFQNNEILTDITEPTSVDVLLTNLIKGNLLPDALIWITSRPAAANQIPPECVDMVTEVRGFTDQQKEEYFSKRFSDEDLAFKMISHIKTSKSLHIMCHIPVFSWITATVLEHMNKTNEKRELPKTLTEMYIHFLVFQSIQGNRKYHERNEPYADWSTESSKIFLALGKLAFEQLEKGNLIFYEADLAECGIDVRAASVYSGVFTQIFKEERGLHQSCMYSFVHLSVQEFLAAVYAFLTFMNSGINVLAQSQPKASRREKEAEPTTTQKIPVHIFYESQPKSIYECNEYVVKPDDEYSYAPSVFSTDNLPIYTEVLEGSDNDSEEFSGSPGPGGHESYYYDPDQPKPSLTSVEHLYFNVPHPGFASMTYETPNTAEFIFYQSAVDRALQSENGHLDLFLRFLLGLSMKNNQTLLTSLLTQSAGSSKTKTPVARYIKEKIRGNLPPERAINLFHCLNELNDHTLVEWIQHYLASESLSSTRLSPAQWSALCFVLLTSKEAPDVFDLRKYPASEDGLLMMMPVVKASQVARLSGCDLSRRSCEALASALSSKSCSLTELDLNHNDVQDLGVELLCGGLGSPYCRLQILRLRGCYISEQSCRTLASVLGSSSLRELDLSHNDLKDRGVKLLCAAWNNGGCAIQSLSMIQCNLSEQSCENLASVLRSRSCQLKELDLSNNDLKDSGVKRLSAVLGNQHCELRTLRLSGCLVMEEGCASLASALRFNPTNLVELDLSYNHPGDTGERLLSAAKQNPDFSLLTLSLEPGGPHFLKPGPMKYFRELTLDVNSAHKKLAVAQGNQQVTRSKEKQPYPEHQKRFNIWPQVLCRDALTGRCYWEVEHVGKVEVGVVYRGLKRKGPGPECGLGMNPVSWCMSCSGLSYTARHGGREVVIPPRSRPSRRLAVSLNWSAGLLSFYSVSSFALSHLHTFHATFTEPLYPAFRLGSASSMTICPPD